MLSKNDLKLIGSFIDSKNMKECLNYCLVNEKGIFATDTKRLFHLIVLVQKIVD